MTKTDCIHCSYYRAEAEIRADERQKVFEWITGTSHITCDEGDWYVYDTEAREWHHTKVEELLELYDKRLEEGENK